MFMVPLARRLLVDWEHEAPLTVAAFRAEAGGSLGEPDYQALVGELLDSCPDFTAVWARQDVRGRLEGVKRFGHPTIGRFDLELTAFQVAEQPSLRLYLYTPAHSRSERLLREAAAADFAPAAEGHTV